MIAITGATGQLGRLVIQELLQVIPANQIIAAVRTPDNAKDLAAQGIQIRLADYDQPATLDSALQGVEKLLLISSDAIGQRTTQHKAVIDAAKRAHIHLIAYTSVLHANTSTLALATEHQETEALLTASELPVVLLRNGWYTENYAAGIPAALQHGVVLGSAGEGRIASASRADYAAAAAAVLTKPDQAGKIYELAGDSSYTLADLATELSRQTGKTIPYQNLPEAEYAAILANAGLPKGFADILAQSDQAASEGALFDDSHQLSQLIGRSTASLADSIKAALA